MPHRPCIEYCSEIHKRYLGPLRLRLLLEFFNNQVIYSEDILNASRSKALDAFLLICSQNKDDKCILQASNESTQKFHAMDLSMYVLKYLYLLYSILIDLIFLQNLPWKSDKMSYSKWQGEVDLPGQLNTVYPGLLQL